MSLDDFIKQLLGEFEDGVYMDSEPAFQLVLPLPKEIEHA